MKINLVDDDSNNIENLQRINDNPTKSTVREIFN